MGYKPSSQLQVNIVTLLTKSMKCYRMGKKHKHEKHHRHKADRHSTDSMDYEDPPPNLIPKLIVKFGSENTPERSDSPAAPVLEQNEVVYSGESFSHHHRHKDKKKKKKKDKKKSHEKDRDH